MVVSLTWTKSAPQPAKDAMKDKTRRFETGKMLLDLAKFSATVMVIGSLASGKMDWRIAVLGLIMAGIFWAIGFLTIPEDKVEE